MAMPARQAGHGRRARPPRRAPAGRAFVRPTPSIAATKMAQATPSTSTTGAEAPDLGVGSFLDRYRPKSQSTGATSVR